MDNLSNVYLYIYYRFTDVFITTKIENLTDILLTHGYKLTLMPTEKFHLDKAREQNAFKIQ